MTGEQIVGISVERLEAMLDTEMLEFFKDCLVVTRPPEEVKIETKETPAKKSSSKKKKIDWGELMKQMNLPEIKSAERVEEE